MTLFDLVRQGGYKSVAVMGLAKNTGKTVTLNQLIEESMDHEVVLGLSSIGRDGERTDVVMQSEKPTIFAPAGTLLATALGTLAAAEAKVEVLRTTDFTTPMGDVVIARVREAGNVEIAGADSNEQIKKTMVMMSELGADLLLLDGALDRVTAASPSVTDAVIIATGAALDRDMNRVIERTTHLVEMFKLPLPEDEQVLKAARELIGKRQIGIITGDCKVEVLPFKTALDAGREIAAAVHEDTRALVFGGSLTSTVLKAIIASVRDVSAFDIIVGDGTRLFLSPQDYKIFVRRGGRLRAADKINLLAVTVNSQAPHGFCFDAVDFLQTTGKALSPIPVFDNFLCRSENSQEIAG